MCPTRLEILMECPGLVKPDDALLADIRGYLATHYTEDNFLNIKRILKALKGESYPDSAAEPPDLHRIIYAALLLALPPQDPTQAGIRKESVRVLYEEIFNHLSRLREARGITEKSSDIYLNWHGICRTLAFFFLLSTFLYTGFTYLDLRRRREMKKRFMQKLAEFKAQLATNPIREGERGPARRAFAALCKTVASDEKIPFLPYAQAQDAMKKPLLYLYQIYKSPEIIHVPTSNIPDMFHCLVMSMCANNWERVSLFLSHLSSDDTEGHATSALIEITNKRAFKFQFYDPNEGLKKRVVYSENLDNDKQKFTDQLVDLITKPLAQAQSKLINTTIYCLNPDVKNRVSQPPLLTLSHFPQLPLFKPPPQPLMEGFIFASLESVLLHTTSDTNNISQHIEALINRHPRIVNVMVYDATLAHICVRYNHISGMEIFIKHKLNVKLRNGEGQPLLFFATILQKVEMVDILLKAHADVDQTDEKGFTPLFWASENADLQITKLLLDAGASVNTRCHGFYPLHMAASRGHTEIVKLLLRYRADVDQFSANRFTPLCCAIATNKPDVVRVLLQHNALLTYRCGPKRKTPLELAEGKTEIMEIIKQHTRDG